MVLRKQKGKYAAPGQATQAWKNVNPLEVVKTESMKAKYGNLNTLCCTNMKSHCMGKRN